MKAHNFFTVCIEVEQVGDEFNTVPWEKDIPVGKGRSVWEAVANCALLMGQKEGTRPKVYGLTKEVNRWIGKE